MFRNHAHRFAAAAAALTLLAAAFLTGGIASAAEGSHLIAPTSLGGAKLGLPASAYARIFGRIHFRTRFAGGITRLEFTSSEVHVYLRSGRGVAIMTAAEEYRTPEKVGPCSSVDALRAAYGTKLTPMKRHGFVVAYRLNRLLFVVHGRSVTSAVLATPTFPLVYSANGAQCGIGDEG